MSALRLELCWIHQTLYGNSTCIAFCFSALMCNRHAITLANREDCKFELIDSLPSEQFSSNSAYRMICEDIPALEKGLIAVLSSRLPHSYEQMTPLTELSFNEPCSLPDLDDPRRFEAIVFTKSQRGMSSICVCVRLIVQLSVIYLNPDTGPTSKDEIDTMFKHAITKQRNARTECGPLSNHRRLDGDAAKLPRWTMFLCTMAAVALSMCEFDAVIDDTIADKLAFNVAAYHQVKKDSPNTVDNGMLYEAAQQLMHHDWNLSGCDLLSGERDMLLDCIDQINDQLNVLLDHTVYNELSFENDGSNGGSLLPVANTSNKTMKLRGGGNHEDEVTVLMKQLNSKVNQLQKHYYYAITRQVEVETLVEKTIRHVFQGQDSGIISEVCSKYTGCPGTDIDDVHLKLQFDAFVAWGASSSQNSQATQRQVYRAFLAAFMLKSWKLACRMSEKNLNENEKGIPYGELSESAGMEFFGMQSSSGQSHFNFERLQYRTFREFIFCLVDFISELKKPNSKIAKRSTSHYERPSREKASIFLRKRQQTSESNNSRVEAYGDRNDDSGDCCEEKNSCDHDVAKNTCSVEDDQTLRAHEEECLAGPAPSDLLARLVLELGESAVIDSRGMLGMKEREMWSVVGNSNLFAQQCSQHLHKLLRLGSDKPIPVDVAAGVTPCDKGECFTKEGPIVKIHVQRLDTGAGIWQIVVPVFEDHLSKEFTKKWIEAIDEVKFASYNDNTEKFLRLACTWASKDKIPLFTFGNNEDRLRLLRAIGIEHDCEFDVLTIGNWMLQQYDIVMRSCLKQLTEKLKSQRRRQEKEFSAGVQSESSTGTGGEANTQLTSQSTSISCGREDAGSSSSLLTNDTDEEEATTSTCESDKSSGKRGVVEHNTLLSIEDMPMIVEQNTPISPCESHVTSEPKLHYFPIAKKGEEPLDSGDFLAILAGKLATYIPHSDSHPDKFCIRNDEIPKYHHSMMRIVTSSIGFDKNSAMRVPTSARDSRGPILYMNHEIDEKLPFIYAGHYTGGEEEFVNNDKKRNNKIAICSDIHAHTQMWGSQGPLHHRMTKPSSLKKDKVRVVYSMRKTEPHHLSAERRQEVFKERNKQPVVDYSNEHKRKGILNSVLKQPGGHVTPLDKIEAMSVEEVAENDQTAQPFKFEVGYHSNDKEAGIEQANRCKVVGLPPNTNFNAIARSPVVVKAFYENRCSVDLKLDNGTVARLGPLVAPKGNRLVRPGEFMDDLNARVKDHFNLKENNHCGSIFNELTSDVLRLLRPGKNSTSFLENVLNVLLKDELNDMTIRVEGGAMVEAGQYTPDTSSDKVYREAPTHNTASSQDPDSTLAQQMRKACAECGTIHVFFRDLYVGLFEVTEVTQKRLSDKKVNEENNGIKQKITEISEAKPDKFGKLMCDYSEKEVMSMNAVSTWVTLSPVFPNSPTEFEGVDNWKTVSLKPKDFVPPTVFLNDDNFTKCTSVSDDMCYNTVPKVLAHRAKSFPFIKRETRDRLIQENMIHIPEDAEGKERDENYDPWHNNAMSKNMDQVLGLSIHSAVFTIGKGCGDCVLVEGKNEKKSVMRPPREIYDQIYNQRKLEGAVSDKFNQDMDETGTKTLMIRPTHPPHLHLGEPGNHMLWSQTKACDPQYQQLDENNQWKERHGPDYFQKNHEAFVISFRSLICCIQTPTSLVKNSKILGGFFAPNPDDPDELNRYIAYVKEHQWNENRFIHPNFHGLFKSSTEFTSFVKQFASEGRVMLNEAITRGKNDLANGPDRFKVLRILRFGMIRKFQMKMSDFQIHVIMRTIETVLHDPFGDPDVATKIPTGWGGSQGANCLIKEFKEKWRADKQEECPHRDSKIKELIPRALVEHFNDWARPACTKQSNSDMVGIEADEDESERKKRVNEKCIKLSLMIMGLEWSEKLGCLVHVYGNGRKLNVCDAEHMLCMYTVIYKKTLPSENQSEDPRLDGEKYFPVRCTSIDGYVKDLPFMEHLRDQYTPVTNAYREIIKCKDFKFHCLHPMFGIDFVNLESKRNKDSTGAELRAEEGNGENPSSSNANECTDAATDQVRCASRTRKWEESGPAETSRKRSKRR